MSITLVLIVLVSAIVMFFSQEFSALFKKIGKIKGIVLIVPLFIASWLILLFDEWTRQGVYYSSSLLNKTASFIARFIPFEKSALLLSQIILLTFLSVAPILLLEWHLRRKYYKEYPFPYLLSAFIWFIGAFLLVIASTHEQFLK